MAVSHYCAKGADCETNKLAQWWNEASEYERFERLVDKEELNFLYQFSIESQKQALEKEWTPRQPKNCTCGAGLKGTPMHSHNCLRRDLGLPKFEALDGEQ